MSEFDYKSLTKEELSIIFQDTLSFAIDPMWHQLISLCFSSIHNRVLFLHDVGTGKTLTSLWTTQLWKSKKILVVCPSSAFNAWERDITKYTNMTYDFLTGSGRERKTKLKKQKDIVIVNYEGLKVIYAQLVKKKGWKINKNLFIHNFDTVIFDEVHKCKAYGSLQSRICFALSKRADYVIGLTGTAFDSDLLEPFNIYKVIDLGAALGSNFFLYRQKFFKPQFYNWVIKKKEMKNTILKLMAKSTISFDREECFDLPEIQEVIREIEPSPEFFTLQHKIILAESVVINGQPAYLGEVEEQESTGHSIMKARAPLLRELCGGFIYYREDKSDKVKSTYYLKKNAKMEALIDLIHDTSGKLVVFYLFKAESIMLQTALKKEKIKFSILQGGQKPTDKKKAEHDFVSKSDVKVMLTQISTGSEGWDGSVANVAVFYTLVASPKVRKQCIGRIYRKNQRNSCLVVDLLLKKSVDENTLKNKDKRMDFVASAMEFMREYGGVESG